MTNIPAVRWKNTFRRLCNTLCFINEIMTESTPLVIISFMKHKVLHKWNVTPKEAVQIQRRLRKKSILTSAVKKPRFIAGVDVSYRSGKSAACICVLKYPGLRCVEYKTAVCKTKFPYVPGLLTFREGPAVIKCLDKIVANVDIFLFDGQGIAHPRRLGIATHMGILMDKPSIGCAKSFLYGRREGTPGVRKGDFALIKDRNRQIGVVLRSRDNIRPIYVSPGYKIDFKTATAVVMKSLTKYRIPEPLRIAHHLSKTTIISGN